MAIDRNATLGSIAAKEPRAIRLFEQWGIDYCCGGDETLNDLCKRFGVTVREVEDAIGMVAPPPGHRDWTNEPLFEIASFITDHYHAFTREELVVIEELSRKVFDAHAQRHPELSDVMLLTRRLADELLPHMQKEEHVVFPYVSLLEDARAAGTAPTAPPFGTVRNPVRVLLEEHEAAASLLMTIRTVTNHYAVPFDACGSYNELYRRLESLERITHEHMHLENNVLFPRAVTLEEAPREVACAT